MVAVEIDVVAMAFDGGSSLSVSSLARRAGLLDDATLAMACDHHLVDLAAAVGRRDLPHLGLLRARYERGAARIPRSSRGKTWQRPSCRRSSQRSATFATASRRCDTPRITLRTFAI